MGTGGGANDAQLLGLTGNLALLTLGHLCPLIRQQVYRPKKLKILRLPREACGQAVSVNWWSLVVRVPYALLTLLILIWEPGGGGKHANFRPY